MDSAPTLPAELAAPPRAARARTFLLRDRKMVAGGVIVGVLILLTVFGPFVAPYDPDDNSFAMFSPPSAEHLFGTDSFGRDILSRMLAGTQISFTVGLSVAIVSMIVGVAIGLIAGYFGGWVDSLLMRGMDLLWAFPEIILTIGLVAIFGAGIQNIILAISIAYLDDFARIVRADVLTLREEDFTIAARSTGASDLRIILRHIFPNTLTPIIVQATFAVGGGILAESSLTFLGLGVPPSEPTWGMTLNEGRDFIRQAWWISVFPGLAIMITVLGMNLLGDALRDSLDVRGSRKTA